MTPGCLTEARGRYEEAYDGLNAIQQPFVWQRGYEVHKEIDANASQHYLKTFLIMPW